MANWKLAAAVGLIHLAFAAVALAADGNVTLARYPSISPDGKQIVFSPRGDLWKCPIEGGLATRLTAHGHNDLQSAWSRDGQRLAFTSHRIGALNLYIMTAHGPAPRQLTEADRVISLAGFGVDE